VSDTAVRFVFITSSVPRVGSSSVILTLVALTLPYFYCILSFTFSTCPVFARFDVGSLFYVHLKRLTNLVTLNIMFRQPHIPPYRKHIAFYGRCSSGAHLTETHPINMATRITAQSFSRLSVHLSENKIFNYDKVIELVRILCSSQCLSLYWYIYSVLLILKSVVVFGVGSGKFEY
jgi:hypothetical protein